MNVAQQDIFFSYFDDRKKVLLFQKTAGGMKKSGRMLAV